MPEGLKSVLYSFRTSVYQNVPGAVAAGGRRHHSVLLQSSYEVGCAVVADAELPLYERNAYALVPELKIPAEIHNLGIQGIVFQRVSAAGDIHGVRILFHEHLGNLVHVLRLASGPPGFGEHIDFIIGGKGAVQPADVRRIAVKLGQHVAPAQKTFGSLNSQHQLRLDVASYLEGDLGRQVGLDLSGNELLAGRLGSQKKMNAHGTGPDSK